MKNWNRIIFVLLCFFAAPRGFAQSIVPATDGTGTIVVPQNHRIDIQGGTQTGSNLFHSFEKFNLDANQTANFIANPTIQNILGRVVGGDASRINGFIQVSGAPANLVLINPAGILFGSTAQINVPAAFTATTATRIGLGDQAWFSAIGANDYSALLGAPDQFAFAAQPGAILNAGNLAVKPGQNLSLLGGTVINVGTLSASDGKITIAAISGGNLIRVSEPGSLLSVELSDVIDSLAAKSLPELLTGGNLGNATQVIVENGAVKLASSPAVPLESGTAIVSGTLFAPASDAASTIQIFGEKIALLGANLTASGTQGTVLIGGDVQGQGTMPHAQFLFGDDKTIIRADRVVLWADQATRFHGTISTERAGFIETSGKRSLDISGAKIDAGGGIWLLDPSDINIVNSNETPISGVFDPPTTTTIDPDTITIALDNGTNVTITTTSGTGGNGDITLMDSINQTGKGAASLTLTGRRFLRKENAVINLNSTGELRFQLNQVNPEPSPLIDSIQNAIDAIGNVNGTRHIDLGAGVYRGTGAQLSINKDVHLNGNRRDDTILSGENLSRVIQVDSGVSASIQNLTIVNGRTLVNQSGGGIVNFGNLDLEKVDISQNNAANVGGGIFNVGTLTISNSTFDKNSAGFAGGGIRNTGRLIVSDSSFSGGFADYAGAISNVSNADTTVNNSTFLNNTANVNGGAIANDSHFLINQSIFTNNRALNAVGGAISNTGSLTIARSVFRENATGNDSNNAGGAIATFAGLDVSVNVSDSIFTGNRSFIGGAISNASGSRLVIHNTSVRENTATHQGGGLLNADDATITNSTFSGNTATQGGGVFSRSRLSLLNSTISRNAATDGSGLYLSAGTVNIQSSTLTQNRADRGGIFNLAGSVSLQNTIAAGNTGAISPDVLGDFTDLGNNLIGISDGSTGFTVSSLVGSATSPIDPGLGALANNGGLTETHALLPGSPAINAGNTAISATDQRGVPRVQQGAIDIGAVESNLLPPASSTPPVSPSLPTINPTDFTYFNALIQSDSKAQQAVSSAVDLERSLTQEIARYYGLIKLPNPVTLHDIQNLLIRAQQQKEARSAIVYAMFVPSVITPAPQAGELLSDRTQPITPLLRSRLKRDDDRLELILVTATGQARRYSTLATRAQAIEQAKLYRLAVSDVEDEQGYQVLSQQFFSWLVQPLETELQKANITSLIYCLDEGLRTIPIAAMANSSLGQRADHGFVIDRYTVSVIPSVSWLNPDFTPLSGRTILAMGADTFQALDPLPAVPTELTLISEQLWQGNHFLNQDFTLSRLNQEKKRANPAIVHLSTHAKFNAGSPEQSYIQFWDQPLKLSQMPAIEWANPPLQLLVLSACDTAIDSRDAELGFAGLAAASGVHSVLASLWSVSDLGTLALMSEFYSQLQTAPTRSEALRRAQAALQNGTVYVEKGILVTSRAQIPLPSILIDAAKQERIEFRHPFYWSSFTLIGNSW